MKGLDYASIRHGEIQFPGVIELAYHSTWNLHLQYAPKRSLSIPFSVYALVENIAEEPHRLERSHSTLSQG